MINLLEETIEALEIENKKPEDVCFVIFENKDGVKIMSRWDDFVVSSNFEYDEGYGIQEINSSLKIIGEDWWLERYEYDGSECWEFKTMPKTNKCIYMPVTKEDLWDGYEEFKEVEVK